MIVAALVVTAVAAPLDLNQISLLFYYNIIVDRVRKTFGANVERTSSSNNKQQDKHQETFPKKARLAAWLTGIRTDRFGIERCLMCTSRSNVRSPMVRTVLPNFVRNLHIAKVSDGL